MDGVVATIMFILGVVVVMGSFVVPFLTSMLRRRRENAWPKLRVVDNPSPKPDTYQMPRKRR